MDRTRLAIVLLGAALALSLLSACGAQAQAPGEPPSRTSAPRAGAVNPSKAQPKPEPASGNPTPGSNRPKPRPGNLVPVTRVVDGDTIEASYRGSTADIRLIGIDTPETVHPSEPVECFGPAASRFATSALTGETVRLEFDVERRDHYGRLLAYVWDDGKLFNGTLVLRGFATVSTYPPNVKYVERFTAAQSQAQAAGRGLWEGCSTRGHEPSLRENTPDGCDGYSPCLSPAPDYDCAGGSGDGPAYTQGPIRVTGSDPYELDSDGNGIACET
jgi:endonuclease YncB( thermonuclease family)